MEHESKSKSSAPMVSATGKKKTAGKRKYKRIVIEAADGDGAMVEHHMPHEERQPDGEGGFRYVPAPEPSKKAFTTDAEAHAHVADIMGLKAGSGKNTEADSTAKDGKKKDAPSGKETPADKKGEKENEEEEDTD